MVDNAPNKPIQSNKIILFFLLAWTVLNVIQACTLELQGDEAYYWMYSRYLAWGYFDHPPMVALFIRIGDSLMHNELGLRLLTVLASTASVYLLWLILKRYAVNALAFVLVVSGIFIFHIYGFTTTPDVPLFFFTVLFYFFYQKYLDGDKWQLALILGVIVACLLYSKYNGVLVLACTLGANIKLLKRASFWVIVILAVVLYIPHILWQVSHGYPSINYHLFERSARVYDFTNTFSYLPGQLLMAGPFIGWFLFYRAFKVKVRDAFIRTLLVNCAGTLIFFWISSSKGEVQPQWTFILFAPLVMLSLIGFKQVGGWPKWFIPVAVINLSVILIVRVIVIAGFGFAKTYGHLKSYYGFKEWAVAVKQKAGDNYIIMNEGFQNPSKYNYYTNSLKCFAYDGWYYRRTQFDIWPMEDSLQHKRIYYLNFFPVEGVSTDSIKLEAGTWYGGWVDDVRTYQKINFDTPLNKITASTQQRITFDFNVTNPYPYAVNFSNTGQKHKLKMMAYFLDGENVVDKRQADSTLNNIILQPGQSTHYKFDLTAPVREGDYELVFSLKTDPFPGSKNSKIFSLKVRKPTIIY